MNSPTPCPDSRQLESLLQDRLDVTDQSALTDHVGECSACQGALDRIAAGPKIDLQTVERDRPGSDSAYWSAVAKLERDITLSDTSASAPARDVGLDFLAPSDDPAHLGRLDHFAILGVVGRGGMGVVLKGFDTHLAREVAVKVLDPAMAADETARKRFCRESRAAASITHEHVVAVHHVAHEESSDLPYLVMQLIDGEALDERLARVGRMELKDIVRIGAQVAAGLAAAHEKGLIHRDIKPANVLLERGTDRVKLTDFGLARAAEDVRLTRSGMVAGTPLYMAPEQARGEEVDGRADLFSLGVLLYELCTGRTPFDARTPLAVLKRLTEEKHQPVRELRPDVPEWLTDLIDRLLAKSPDQRFQSAREVADLLDHFWSAIKTSSQVTPSCPIKRARRLRQVAILLTAVAAGAALTAAVMLWPGRATQSGTEEESVPPLAVLRGNAGSVWSVAFSPGDATLAMAIETGTVKLWDLETNNVRTTLTGHRASVWSAVFSRDGSQLLTSSDDGTARLWDLAENTATRTLETSAAARAALFDRDGKSVLTGDRQGNVRVWDLATGAEGRTWRHSGAVYALALSPDGRTAATSGSDKVVRLWDARAGRERMSLDGHTGPVYSVVFRPDGKMLASSGWDGTIRLWDVGTGDLLRSVEGHGRDVWGVSFSPDGRTIASAGQDGTVRVWDAASGEQLAVFRGHEGTVHTVSYSRDGTRIASGGRDGTVRLWQAVGPKK